MPKTKTNTTTTTETKTCQICGRGIKLRGETIALHGYQRPGSGYQTGSCPGAQHLPFEVSCDLLRGYVERCAASIERQKAELAAEITTASLIIGYHYIGKTRVAKTVSVTEATFGAALEEHNAIGYATQNGAQWHEKLTWSHLVARMRAWQKRDLENSVAYHGEQSRRLAKWVAPV